MEENQRNEHFKRVINACGQNDLQMTCRYEVCNKICAWFEAVMPKNEKFIFDEPCAGCGSYDIYAIQNFNGIIMAEYIPNYRKAKGDYTHEVGTKGTESVHAMLFAQESYLHGRGTVENHPEWESKKPVIVIG